jgi:hypothetical protein
MSANMRTLLARGKAPKATETVPSPVVSESAPTETAVFCKRCGTPRLPRKHCQTCHPSRWRHLAEGPFLQQEPLARHYRERPVVEGAELCHRCGEPVNVDGRCVACSQRVRSRRRSQDITVWTAGIRAAAHGRGL